MRVPDWLVDFDENFASSIASRLAPVAGRRVAVFDADGTLWYDDIGEAFARWLAAGGLLKQAPGAEAVWVEYERRLAESRDDAYTWIVQIMAGLDEADIDRWARQLAAAWPCYRKRMKRLIAGLQSEGFETWIVSASNYWIVRATAPYMGIPEDHVLGIQLRIRDGALTTRPVYPRPTGQGKVDAIQKHIGVRPVFAFGDSMGDFPMLAYAEQPLVVGRRDLADNDLVRHAPGRRWPVNRF